MKKTNCFTSRISASFNKFKKLHLRNQQLVVFLSLAIIPVIIITLFVYGVFIRRMSDETDRNLGNTISQISLNIDIIVRRIEAISTVMVYTDRVQTYLTNVLDGEEISRFEFYTVEQQLANFYDFNQIRSITLSDMLGNAVQFPLELSNHFTENIRSFAENKNYYTPIWVNDVENGIVHLVRAVQSTKNYRRIGYLDVAVYPELFQMQFKNLSLQRDCHIILLDNEMKVLTGTGNAIIPELTERILRGRENFKFRENGKIYSVFLKKSEVTNWTTVAYISTDSIHEGVARIGIIVAIVIICIILVSIVVSLNFSNFFSNRIHRVNSAMQQFAQGDLNVRLLPDENPEFNTISLHFNEMVQQIQRLINSEYQYKMLAAQAELKMLQAQINPHFLYNTLNVIYWKCQIANQHELAEMVASLSGLLHESIDRGENFATVEHEIKNIENYLYIQKMRYKDKISTAIDIAENIKQCRIPRLILQPIVENAFVHGLEPKKGNGSVSILGREQGDELIFEIKDDGVGMNKNVKEMLLTEQNSKGFQGLLNIDKRLQLLYGEGCGLSVESEEGKGTVIVMKILKEMKNV